MIAEKAFLLSTKNKPLKILPTVSNWLKGTECGSWLMIIDNADDNNIFFGIHSGNRESKKPKGVL